MYFRTKNTRHLCETMPIQLRKSKTAVFNITSVFRRQQNYKWVEISLFHTHTSSFIIPSSHLAFDFFYTFSIIHTIFYLWSTFILLFLSFSLFLFLSTSFRSSAAFSSGCKRTNHHKSTPLLLLRRENAGREGVGAWEMQEKRKKDEKGWRNI